MAWPLGLRPRACAGGVCACVLLPACARGLGVSGSRLSVAPLGLFALRLLRMRRSRIGPAGRPSCAVILGGSARRQSGLACRVRSGGTLRDRPGPIRLGSRRARALPGPIESLGQESLRRRVFSRSLTRGRSPLALPQPSGPARPRIVGQGIARDAGCPGDGIAIGPSGKTSRGGGPEALALFASRRPLAEHRRIS